MKAIIISVRLMYVDVYIYVYSEEKFFYLLKWMGNLVCSLSNVMKMITL